MNLRLKFSKYGFLKYVGHLDFMRYMQKAVRRAGIDIRYTEGFSPHQVMSFALPLSVGLTSDGEYLDMEVNSIDSLEDTIKRLNNAMSDGIHISGIYALPDWEPNKKKVSLMSLVAAADYKINFKSKDVLPQDEFNEAFTRFMSQEGEIILKKGKKAKQEVDVRTYVYEYAFQRDAFTKKTGRTTEDVVKSEEHAEAYDCTIVYLRLAAGSAINIKPELVIESFYDFSGIDSDNVIDDDFMKVYPYQIHRMELYKKVVVEDKEVFVPLSVT